MSLGKEDEEYLRDVEVISWEMQLRLVIADVDKKKIEEDCEKGTFEKIRVWKLNVNDMRARLGESWGVDKR